MVVPQFVAPQRILLGPGPSPVAPEVLRALSQPTIGHLDPAFIALMDEVKSQLRGVFRTQNPVTFPISGPGSAAMEAAFSNLIAPGTRALVCRNGAFGERMRNMIERFGGCVTVVDADWGREISPEAVEKSLQTNPPVSVLAFVHAETSTGVQSDAGAICKLAKKYGALSVVDCVTSLGGIPVEVDDWQADVVYSGSQKCLSCPPGLAPITFSSNSVAAVKARKHPVANWFHDISLLTEYWNGAGARTYHHTAPINMIYGLHAALRCVIEEGLEQAWGRHARVSKVLCDELETLGLSLPIKAQVRLPQVTVVEVPNGINDGQFRRQLLDTHDLEIGGGLGPFASKIWRIGLMGFGATLSNAKFCAATLGSELAKHAIPIKSVAPS